MKTVMEFRRHADTGHTTLRYLHLIGEALEGAVGALAQFATQSDAVPSSAEVVPLKRVSQKGDPRKPLEGT
jgi:hypothetical protein